MDLMKIEWYLSCIFFPKVKVMWFELGKKLELLANVLLNLVYSNLLGVDFETRFCTIVDLLEYDANSFVCFCLLRDWCHCMRKTILCFLVFHICVTWTIK